MPAPLGAGTHLSSIRSGGWSAAVWDGEDHRLPLIVFRTVASCCHLVVVRCGHLDRTAQLSFRYYARVKSAEVIVLAAVPVPETPINVMVPSATLAASLTVISVLFVVAPTKKFAWMVTRVRKL